MRIRYRFVPKPVLSEAKNYIEEVMKYTDLPEYYAKRGIFLIPLASMTWVGIKINKR